MPLLGTLRTVLTLDNRGLETGARQSETTLGRLGARSRELTTQIAKLGVGLGVAGAALAANLTRQGLSAVDAQIKLARSLDGTADGVRAVQIAAKDAGVDVGIMDDAMGKLNQRIGEAMRGTGAAAESFERLGLNAEELSAMDTDQRMAAIADRMHAMGLSSAQAADELRQMGIRNDELTLLMRQGGDAIRSARAEVDEYGLSLSDVDAAQVEAANDAFSRIGRVIEVIRQRLAVQLAPIIEYIADLINDATKEAGRFRDQIDDAITRGVRMGGKLADVIEGVRRTFLLAGQGAAAFAIGVQAQALRMLNALVNGPIKGVNFLIDQMNRIPGVEIPQLEAPQFAQNLERELETARRAYDIAIEDMQETLLAPLPSTGLEQRLDEIREKSRLAAEQVVADRERMAGPGGLGAEGEEEEVDEAHRAALERRLERLREALMEEGELITHRHQQALEELRHFREAELVTEEEFATMTEQLEKQHQDALTALLREGEEERHDEIRRFAKANQAMRENAITQEASALRSGLQTMFGDNKAAVKAMTALKRIEAISSAYAWGSSFGGPPAGAAAAATAAAAQMRSVRAAGSASFTGGVGNVGGVEGSASIGAQTQQQVGPARNMSVTLVGNNQSSFSMTQVRGLMEQMREQLGDGVSMQLIEQRA